MAFQPAYVSVFLEVRPAPSCFLAASPQSLAVDRGTVAQFTITVTKLNGYAGPVYLRLPFYTGQHSFSVNPVNDEGQSILSVNTDQWDLASATGPKEIVVEGSDVPL